MSERSVQGQDCLHKPVVIVRIMNVAYCLPSHFSRPGRSQKEHGAAQGLVCVAAASKSGSKSRHPNRQNRRPYEELQGSSSPWITVSIPALDQPKWQAGQHGARHHQQQNQSEQVVQQQQRHQHPQQYSTRKDRHGQEHPSQHKQQQQRVQKQRVQQQYVQPVRNPTGQFFQNGRDSTTMVQSPAEILHTASQLAAAAGSDVTIHGPRLRRRMKPVRGFQYMGVYGQSHSQWFLWRQWLAGRKRISKSKQAGYASGATVDVTRSSIQSRDSTQSQQLCMLDMDDWDFDIEELDEGIREDMLYRSKRDIEAHLAMSTWQQLMVLHTRNAAGSSRQTPSQLHLDKLQHGGNNIKHMNSRTQQQQQQQQQQARAASAEVDCAASTRQAPTSLLPVHVFKGGGYVAADLAAMLQNTGLSRVLQLQLHLQGAHCILVMPKWKSGKIVDLRQQRAAALKRRIPLIFTRSLRPSDVLLALRPLFMDLGLLQEEQAAAQRQVITLKRSEHMAGPVTTSAKVSSNSSSSEQQMTGAVQHVAQQDSRWPLKQQTLLQQLAEGSLNVCGYIQATQL